MGRGVAALVALAVLFSAFASTASGFEGGGTQPSKAPSITPGVHYFAKLNNHASEANEKYNGGYQVAFWRLPPLASRDQIVVSWHEVPFSHRSGFPIGMAVLQHANDANWGAQFESEYTPTYGVSGSGSAETSIVAQEPTTDAYLAFYAGASASSLSDLEDFPYDFTVSGPLHYLSAAISPAEHVRANGTVSASVTDANGSPAPDGLQFTLNVSKNEESIATYTATTSGGGLTFQLALPEALVNEYVELVVTRGADGTYQAVESAEVSTQVAKASEPPPPPAPEPSSACVAARNRAHALARQLHRLRQHATRARSRRRHRRLHRRAHRVAGKLRGARAHAGAVC